MLIFEPGFSTAEVVTDVSGRGVGMDVVKRNISALGGRIEIDSVEGLGTRITIRLPLTLAILDGLSVAVGRETYIIPLTYIVESLLLGEDDLRSVSGEGQLMHVRGEYLPVVALRELFNLPRSTKQALAGGGDRRIRRQQDRVAGGRTGRSAPGGDQEPGIQFPQGAGYLRRNHHGRRESRVDPGCDRALSWR